MGYEVVSRALCVLQVSAYWKEYIDRLTFRTNEHAKTTESRATQLLNDMLPKQVGGVAVAAGRACKRTLVEKGGWMERKCWLCAAQVLEEFQQDKLRLAYKHNRVTFLFADICGFTNWAKGVDACEASLENAQQRQTSSSLASLKNFPASDRQGAGRVCGDAFR